MVFLSLLYLPTLFLRSIFGSVFEGGPGLSSWNVGADRWMQSSYRDPEGPSPAGFVVFPVGWRQ